MADNGNKRSKGVHSRTKTGHQWGWGFMWYSYCGVLWGGFACWCQPIQWPGIVQTSDLQRSLSATWDWLLNGRRIASCRVLSRMSRGLFWTHAPVLSRGWSMWSRMCSRCAFCSVDLFPSSSSCETTQWVLRNFWLATKTWRFLDRASRKILLKCAQKRCYKSILVLLYVLRCLCVEEAGSCSGRSAATLWEKLWSCVNISCLCLKSKWFQMLIQFFSLQAMCRSFSASDYCMYVCM
jgi:hypothetical protein